MGGDEYWMHSWSKMWVLPKLFGAYVFLWKGKIFLKQIANAHNYSKNIIG